MLSRVNRRPALLIRWEDLAIGIQVTAAFVVSFVAIVVIHMVLLNQPFERSLWYGLFWGVLATVVIVSGTRTERARRLRDQDPRADG
jgi:undecaprenyl pyrophosphate phosphatase UppP